MFFCYVFLLACVILYLVSCKYFLKQLNKKHFSLSRKLSSKLQSGDKTVMFVKENGYWVCLLGNEKVDFQIHGCAFRKAFLLSFVTRAIRYPSISGNKKAKMLGKHIYKGLNKSLNVVVIFKSKNKETRKSIVKNGCSKCGLISMLIIKSKLPCSPQHHRPISESLSHQIIYLDEETFVKI